MYKITIRKGYDDQKKRCWVTDHTDPEVLELFGTITLPTPYNLTNSENFVLAKIIQNNPDREVTLA